MCCEIYEETREMDSIVASLYSSFKSHGKVPLVANVYSFTCLIKGWVGAWCGALFCYDFFLTMSEENV